MAGAAGARVRVRAHPGAKRAQVVGRMADGQWKLSVPEPPADGRANQALTRLLSEALGGARVRIVSGMGSRGKVFEVEGLDEAEISRRLQRAAQAGGKTEG